VTLSLTRAPSKFSDAQGPADATCMFESKLIRPQICKGVPELKFKLDELGLSRRVARPTI
jgi:hypothetical protein